MVASFKVTRSLFVWCGPVLMTRLLHLQSRSCCPAHLWEEAAPRAAGPADLQWFADSQTLLPMTPVSWP